MKWVWFLFLGLAWISLPLGAGAHGGGTLQISNAPAAACLVSVWSAPTNPRAGDSLHITVGLAEAAAQTPVLDGEVLVVVAADPSGEQVAEAPATTAQSINRLFYEADIPGQPAGVYNIIVDTECRGERDFVTFSLEVQPATNPLFIIVPLVIGIIFFGFFLRRSWRWEKAVDVPRRR